MSSTKMSPVEVYNEVMLRAEAIAERNGYATYATKCGDKYAFLAGYLQSTLQSALLEMNQAQLKRFKLYNT